MRAHLATAAGLALAIASPASAWHGDGHEAVARIAWLQLDEKTHDSLTRILKSHRHFKLFLHAPLPPGVHITTDEWAFVRAARWPDWVRDPRAETTSLTPEQSKAIHEFHHGDWHFVNLPIAHPADAEHFGEARLAELTRQALEPETEKKGGVDTPRHALAALKKNLGVLRDDTAPDADRAVALCWVLHLAGDLHQPLHAAALIARAESLPASEFTPPPAFDAPAGDSGGNRVAVRLKPTDTKSLVLHSFWDALVFDDARQYAPVEAKLRSLLRRDDLQPDRLQELKDHPEALDWAKESQDLARTVAYRKDGKPDGAILDFIPLPDEPGKVDAILAGLKAPVLSGDYQKQATATAERRIVLAGLRLAGLLKPAG
jgi:hypothetical protein